MDVLITKEYRIMSNSGSTLLDTLLSLENQVNLCILNNWQLEGGVSVIEPNLSGTLKTTFIASQAMSRLKEND